MATYAIGDIQGCYEELQHLLDLIQFSDSDQLWLCGDLVNRGPNSLETLRFINSLGDRAVTVLGNHDLHLLALHHGGATVKRSDTLSDILAAPDRDALMHWLQQQPLFHTDPALNFSMVHAGIPPTWSIKEAKKRSLEVEQILKSPLAAQFFKHMYGNTPVKWDKNLEGWDRLRVITNYLTRMRFCTPKGELEFASKGGLETQPTGYLPWFAYPNRKSFKERIVFGHWAALEGSVIADNVYAIDTGCVWGLSLTALRLDDLTRFQTPSLQKAAFKME